jgi:hypothetical protein
MLVAVEDDGTALAALIGGVALFTVIWLAAQLSHDGYLFTRSDFLSSTRRDMIA